MQAQGVMVVALVLAACSGKAGSGSDTDGGGGNGNVGGEDGLASAGDTFQPAPAAQGAITFSLQAPSPAPVGKACPSAAFSSELPTGNGPSESSYLAHVVDGEAGAVVSCRVAGSTIFEISGKVQLAGRGLIIEDGTVGADERGTASITVIDSARLSTSLRGTSCMLSVETGSGSNLQIKSGSVWARFSCPSVESPPSDHCQASGFFVLENCEQQ